MLYPNCQKPLKSDRKSCSVECANILKRKPEVKCARPGCDKPSSKTRKKSIYCSIECFNQHRIDKKWESTAPECPKGVKAIPLTQGMWAFVDESDYELTIKFNWCVVNAASKNRNPIYYAKCTENHKYMHAFILGIEDDDMECLHGVGGTLDNTRKNLRIGSKRENQRDRNAVGITSRYKGVSWNFSNKKWVAHISAGNEYKYLGYFKSEIDAAITYDIHARELHGKFSRLNFPELGETSALELEIDRICIHCGKSFSGPSKLKYCGTPCLINASLPFKNCMNCNKVIRGHRKFCDSSCRFEFDKKCESFSEPEKIPGATWIKLTLGKYCLIDDADVSLISRNDWFAKEGNGNWYACRHSAKDEIPLYGKCVRMHRYLMNLTKDDGRDVGHVDGNSLNNRRDNLNIVNNSNNHKNVFSRGNSGYKGVSVLDHGYYLAKIYNNGKFEYLGRYKSAEEAAKIYDQRARELHNVHGRYNFPNPGERSAKK